LPPQFLWQGEQVWDAVSLALRNQQVVADELNEVNT